MVELLDFVCFSVTLQMLEERLRKTSTDDMNTKHSTLNETSSNSAIQTHLNIDNTGMNEL